MAETIRRPRSAFDFRGISALAIYFALAALFFGRGVCGRCTTSYIGKGVDPQLLMWLIAWWPHALDTWPQSALPRTRFGLRHGLQSRLGDLGDAARRA